MHHTREHGIPTSELSMNLSVCTALWQEVLMALNNCIAIQANDVMTCVSVVLLLMGGGFPQVKSTSAGVASTDEHCHKKEGVAFHPSTLTHPPLIPRGCLQAL